MGLFSNNRRGGILDVIRCDEKSYIVWKWRPTGAELGESGRENSIRWGSSIRVKDGSAAVLVYSGNEGRAQEYIEGPADTIVDTKNFPVISSLFEKLYNGSSPFQAEVYFINLAETIQTRFAVPYFDVFDSDPELKEFSVPIAVRGSIDFKIGDVDLFIKSHRLDNFTIEDFTSQIKDAVIQNTKSAVINAPEYYGIPVVQIERKITEIKDDLLLRLREKFNADYGVYLKDISIAALDINKESEGYKELIAVTKDLTAETRKAKNKISIKDMAANQKLGVFGKAANMFVDVKENAYARRKQTQHKYSKEVEQELAGRVGAAGAKIISALNKKSTSESVQRSSSDGITPPPVPVVSYHIVLFGQPAGPYEMATLERMFKEGGLTKNSLVWTEGMENWMEAGEVEDLAGLFTNINSSQNTPPIPPVPGD
ncbi:MAG: SPFH domain-containing protein [Lachnospiraceae bacterium]|nr:SPFH domain-containing protein [Lachnospiraceae bacterium]